MLLSILDYLVNNIPECIGMLSGLLFMLSIYKVNRSCFLFACISHITYGYITFTLNLYLMCIFNIYALLFSIYGLVTWNKKSNNNIINFLGFKNHLYLISFVFICSLVLSKILFYYRSIESNNIKYYKVYIDSLVFCISVISQYLMTNKYLYNSCYWIFINLIMASLYLYEGLLLSVILQFVYILFSIWILRNWMKIYSNQNTK